MAKVLVVDDSPLALKFIAGILDEADHSVLLCLRGTNAEDLAVQESPDLILLDVVMPDRNGYEILRQLRRNQKTKNIPVCIISGKQEKSDIEWAKRQGANEYLSKPFTTEALLDIIARLELKA